MKKTKSLEDINKIHLVPYSHHDYAWTNTRQWHVWRYIEGFCRMLDLMHKNADYTQTIDNVLHSLEAFETHCPSRVEEFKKRVKEGRIEVVNGGMALARPSLFDGELYIRNITRGKKELGERLGAEKIPVFFNADTGVGHSQMPQLLKLCGHEHYRFYRPEGVLDYQKVPRDFIWKGLDGSKLIVSRGIYGGFMFARWSELPMERWEEVKQSFFDEDLQDKLQLAATDQLLLNLGCDDVMPMSNLFDKEIDIIGFIKNWNSHEKSKIEFSTFEKYYQSIKDKELPEWDGALDPCELSYNAPMRSDDSLWRKRVEGERLLVTAEGLLMILESMGEKTDFSQLTHMWLRMIKFVGHAMQWLISEDYDKVVSEADATLTLIKEQLCAYENRIAELTPWQSKVQYVAINTCGFDRTENISLHITSPLHVHGLILRNARGEKLEYQFTEVFKGDKAYLNQDFNEAKVTCNLTVPAFGFTCITAEFDGGEIKEIAKNQLSGDVGQSFTIDNGVYIAQITQGVIRRLEKKADRTLLYQSNKNNFGGVRLYHTTPTVDWTTQWDDIAIDTFVPETVNYNQRGPVRFAFTSQGRIGRHKAKLETVFVKDDGKITYHLELNNKGAEGYFTSIFPCDEMPKLIAGIPFGQEPRDTDGMVYSETTGATPGDYLYFERGCTGGFYANGFTSYELNGSRMALLQGNCNVYFRNLIKNKEVELVLMKSFDLSQRTEEWMTKVAPSLSGGGVQHFEYAVSILDESAGKSAQMLTQIIRYPIRVATRFSYEKAAGVPERSFFSMEGGSLVLSTAYKDDTDYIFRLFESEGKEGKCLIHIALPFKNAQIIDLCENVMRVADVHENCIELTFRSWEILTLRLSGQ